MPDRKFLFVSFATRDYWPYLDRLERSAYEHLPIRCETGPYVEFLAELREDQPDWLDATNSKPLFIREMLDRYPDVAIVWVDADAEFKAQPTDLLQDGFDFAVCNRPGLGFAGGVLLFTQRSRHLLELWIELLTREPKLVDQNVLADAWFALKSVYMHPKKLDLPLSYATKFDEPDLIPDAIIVHHQASRTHRRRE